MQLIVSIIAYCAAGAFDVISTKIALKNPSLTEGEPILKMSPIKLSIAFKAALLAVILAVLHFHIIYAWLAVVCLILGTVMFFTAALHNLSVANKL